MSVLRPVVRMEKLRTEVTQGLHTHYKAGDYDVWDLRVGLVELTGVERF